MIHRIDRILYSHYTGTTRGVSFIVSRPECAASIESVLYSHYTGTTRGVELLLLFKVPSKTNKRRTHSGGDNKQQAFILRYDTCC